MDTAGQICLELNDNHSLAHWLRRNHKGPMPFPASELDVLDTAGRWLDEGHAVALGTVILTSGSAPRQMGSHIAVRNDGGFAGSVSAGCVEGAVIAEALAVLRDGCHRRLRFGVSDDGVLSIGLICGGEIEVLIEAIG